MEDSSNSIKWIFKKNFKRLLFCFHIFSVCKCIFLFICAYLINRRCFAGHLEIVGIAGLVSHPRRTASCQLLRENAFYMNERYCLALWHLCLPGLQKYFIQIYLSSYLRIKPDLDLEYRFAWNKNFHIHKSINIDEHRASLWMHEQQIRIWIKHLDSAGIEQNYL